MSLKKVSIFLIFCLFITSGFGCTKNISDKNAKKSVKLTVWGIYENEKDLEPLFKAFQKEHPTVSFEYRKFEANEYEKQLTDAWVEDNGTNNLSPDIYFIPNTKINTYKNRITPLPAKIKLPYRQVTQSGAGPFKKTDIRDYMKEEKTISLGDVENLFVPTVYSDVIIDDKIYGLPLSVETLGLFYNKEILDASGIAQAPSSWDELVEDVKKISLLNEDKTTFVQSGASLGGSLKNIPNAIDILILLMKQSGVSVNSGSENTISFYKDKKTDAAVKALGFYTDFANPTKEVYSWNDSMNQALDVFKAKGSAFYFGYPYDIEKIDSSWYEDKKNGEKTWFDIAQVPQITQKRKDKDGNTVSTASNPINIANYQIMTVSHKAKNKDIAWGFIQFATKEKNVKMYLDSTNKATALRSLYGKQETSIMKPFADQALSAKSWYHGTNYTLAKNSMNELIETFKTKNLEEKEINILLENTATNINQDIK